MVTSLRGRVRRRGHRQRAIAIIGAVAVVGLGLANLPSGAAVPLRPRLVASGLAHRSGRLSPRLSTLAGGRSYSSARAAAALSLPASGPGSLVRKPGGRVLVEIRASSTDAAVVGALQASGADIVNVSPTYETITASVTPAALDAVAADPDVTYVSEVLAPLVAPVAPIAAPDSASNTATGAPAAAAPRANGACQPTVSDGDALMNVATARATNGVDGTGETIGVLSDSFDTSTQAPTHAAEDVASGDLPGIGNPCGYTTPVTVQSDYSGGGQIDEGRAMAELAHGLAPGAGLAFATASNGDLDFANQITRLRTVNHASVIVDDETYFDEPFFQDGPIAQAANAASAAGVPYFSAAGNANLIVGGQNVSSYEAPTYRSTTCPASVVAFEPVMSCHNFDPTGGTDNSDDITVAPGGGFGIDLQWAQPWGAVTNDYDVFLLNSAGSVIAGSDNVQSSTETPFEFFGYTNSSSASQTVQIVIAKFSGGADSRIKFDMLEADGITAVQYNTSTDGDIIGPTIFGHNGAASVGSVAAINYNDSTTPEPYSSRGPDTLYFQPTPSTAALPTPEVLDKPDFAATDDVKTAFFGDLAGGTYRFAGTSAAAPQAAAIGALLEDYDPALTPAQIMATLRATARPVATDGTSSDVGGGYLDATAALASVLPVPHAPQQVFLQANGNARVTLQWTPAQDVASAPVVGYRVTPSLNGIAQPARTFASSATTEAMTALSNGGFYTFTVAALNANGAGPPSAPSSPVVVGAPAGIGTVGAVPGNGRAIVTWSKPPVTYGLAIVRYAVQVFVKDKLTSTRVFKSPATTQTVTGLTNGTSYEFEVVASNGFASSQPSQFSDAITVGAPLAPTAVTASAGKGSALVRWKAPNANGSPVAHYSIIVIVNGVSHLGVTVAGTKASQTMPHLIAGKHYSFRVEAKNARGTGPLSAASRTVTVT